MGLFDKIKEIKTQYDNNQEAKREQEEEQKRKAREEREAKENAILEKISSGELMQTIVHNITDKTPWFFTSQGGWDSNRRQVIVTAVAVIVNNHREDTFVQCLESIYIHKDQIEFTFRQEEDSIMASYFNQKLGLDSRAEAVNRWNKQRLAEYESKDYMLETIPYESIGYDPITDDTILERFASVLREQLQKANPSITFTDIRRVNMKRYCFETTVPEKRRKTLI